MKPAARFTLAELRADRRRVTAEARKPQGAIIVDDSGAYRFHLWIKGPLTRRRRKRTRSA